MLYRYAKNQKHEKLFINNSRLVYEKKTNHCLVNPEGTAMTTLTLNHNKHNTYTVYVCDLLMETTSLSW